MVRTEKLEEINMDTDPRFKKVGEGIYYSDDLSLLPHLPDGIKPIPGLLGEPLVSDK